MDALMEELLHKKYGYLMAEEHGKDTELLLDIMKCNGIDTSEYETVETAH